MCKNGKGIIMRIAICDDNKDDRNSLEAIITAYAIENAKNWVVTSFESGSTFIQKVYENDMVLLDIEMPELNGIETGKLARSKNPELKIVMFTGAEGYGEEIFDIGAVDYLSKPVKAERLINAIQRIESSLIGNDVIAANKDWMPFTLKQKSVQYIKAYNGYVLLYCHNEEYRVDKSLKEIEKELDKRIFLRISKSLIINLIHVKKLIGSTFLIGSTTVEISRRRFNEVKKAWIEFDIKYNVGGV